MEKKSETVYVALWDTLETDTYITILYALIRPILLEIIVNVAIRWDFTLHTRFVL